MYGRGAPANGGGDGNVWNAPGGGGANAGDTGAWTGNGNPDITTNSNYITAWNLEYPGFANSTSSGGGRGGYATSAYQENPYVYGPNNSIWSSLFMRENVGGKGGRPLDYSTDRLFLGGGGGSGHEDDNNGGGGGNGGGLIYVLSYGMVNGSGSILSNGQNGYEDNSSGTGAASDGDGAGGAGGGGTIIINSVGIISDINVYANGGVGGNQDINYTYTVEGQGPGGGGGGGYVATSNSRHLHPDAWRCKRHKQFFRYSAFSSQWSYKRR